jgi:hypothetical protein
MRNIRLEKSATDNTPIKAEMFSSAITRTISLPHSRSTRLRVFSSAENHLCFFPRAACLQSFALGLSVRRAERLKSKHGLKVFFGSSSFSKRSARRISARQSSAFMVVHDGCCEPINVFETVATSWMSPVFRSTHE